jgi:hypothetical protein
METHTDIDYHSDEKEVFVNGSTQFWTLFDDSFSTGTLL